MPTRAPPGSSREVEVAVGHERVARILARGDRRQREALRHVHRHVLERMHGEIGAALGHRDLELLDEQPLAADVGERPVEHPVALRRHAEQLDLAAGIERREPRADVLGLPQRQRGFARRDRQAAGRQRAWGSECGNGSMASIVPSAMARESLEAGYVRGAEPSGHREPRPRRRQHLVLELCGEERDERPAVGQHIARSRASAR